MIEQINEKLNLVAMVTGLLPVTVILFSTRQRTWQWNILFFLLLSTALDAITFYFYKFRNQNSYWLTPFYFFSAILFPFLYVFTTEIRQQIKRILVGLFSLAITFITVRLTFFYDFESYEQWGWLLIQLYITAICLIHYNFILSIQKRKVFSNPMFYVTTGILLLFLLPMLSGALQYELYDISKDYFVYSLLVINISGIISYLLIFSGIRLSLKN